MNSTNNISLRKKLERTHLLSGVLSVGIFSIIVMIGYFIYRQTDHVARITGLQAAFLADEFSDIMYGDPITPDLAEDFIYSSGSVPIIKADQEIYAMPEYSDWLVIFDENWTVMGSNYPERFPLGVDLEMEKLPGFTEGHFVTDQYDSFSVPGQKTRFYYAKSGQSHYGLAEMLDWYGETYGYIYFRAAFGYETVTSREAMFFILAFFLGSGIIALILSGLFGRYQAKRIGLRLNQLSKVSEALAAGNYSKRDDESIRDEIGILGGQVNMMADQISAQMQELQAEISEREYLQTELEKLATTDGLTNLFNRRHFLFLADELLNVLEENKNPVSILMIDLDHFKQINDCYGHPIGDKVLTIFGDYLKSMLRKSDICGRYGGEEFVCILPDITAKKAVEIAERLRINTAQLKQHFPDEPISISISIGISSMDWDINYSIYDLIDQADQALYQAKQAGRNQTKVYKSELSE